MNSLKKNQQGLKALALTGQIFLVATHWACGQSTFTTASGSQSWATTTNWTPNGVPSGIDVAVVFNSPTAAQTVVLGGSRIIGSLTIHDTTATAANAISFSSTGGFTLTISATSGTGTGLVDGTGVAVETMGSAVVLTSSLDMTVSNTSVVSSSGAITFTGTMTGAGGFIKDGDGTSSMTTAAKAYTGATTVNAGILRYTATGAASGTSGITVNSGGQLRLDTSGGAFTFGGGGVTVALNGDGDAALGATGLGALADTASNASTLANPVQIVSASTSTVSTASASLALNGIVSGSGALTKAGSGTLYFNNAANTLNGSVAVSAGTVGGSGLISAAVTVSGAGTLLGGSGATGTTLTVSNDLTLAPSSAIALTLGAGGIHSTLARTGGTWTFDAMQAFTLLGSPAVGTYQDIITGLAADPGTESTWTFTNGGNVGTFTYDGANIDLTLTAVVPEPGTVLGGMLLIGGGAWSLRRRLGAVFAA